MRCTTYEQSGEITPGVSKSSEAYSGKVVYENNEGKAVGTISIKAPTSGAFTTDVSTILAIRSGSCYGGTRSHETSEDRFSCTLKCHDSTGEFYSVKERFIYSKSFAHAEKFRSLVLNISEQ